MSSDWAESALRWWQEAGVDTVLGEAPRDWLAPNQSIPPAPGPAPRGETLPADLDSFRAWLASSDSLPFASGAAPRLGPAGDPRSGLMILIDMPSAEDVASGMLLSGEAGQLLDRMLAAIGRRREMLYLASLSPIRPAAGRLDAESARSLAEIARHHIGLVAPAALLLFGDACSKALLGSAVAGVRGKWHELETPSGRVRTLVTIRPEKLISQPNLKKHAWEDLQMLREGLKS